MRRTPVSSSNIASVGYDAASSTLEVGFRNGGVYQYHGVPPSVHQGLMGAGSKGTYLADQVKDRYPYTRV